ncbi:unnamed protein product [Amoebophrya sp. A25]|nr:unnamed protein product [Amoebophrya sp. A25]|eukprot:GSA25T00015294001.1
MLRRGGTRPTSRTGFAAPSEPTASEDYEPTAFTDSCDDGDLLALIEHEDVKVHPRCPGSNKLLSTGLPYYFDRSRPRDASSIVPHSFEAAKHQKKLAQIRMEYTKQSFKNELSEYLTRSDEVRDRFGGHVGQPRVDKEITRIYDEVRGYTNEDRTSRRSGSDWEDPHGDLSD